MAYAGDRLYKEVIRKMMGDLATKVRVREIIAYLPCLTLSDREEIEAKRETYGNYNAMMVLLDNLQRRENWPDQFISALRTCEQWALANKISEEYDKIRGIHTQRRTAAAASAPVLPAVASVSPAAPPAPAPAPAAAVPSPAPAPAEASATVTTATIHSVPCSTPPFLTTSVEASAQPATPLINSPPGPYSNIAAPASTEAPALVSAPDALVHAPPESAQPAEPPLSVLASDARPPSPVSAPTLTPSIGQSEVPGASAPINSSPEPCSNIASPAMTEAPALVSALENSVQPHRKPAHPAEPPLLVPHAIPPSPVSAPEVTPSVGQREVPVDSRKTPTLGISGGPTNTALSGQSSITACTLPTSPQKSNVPVAVVESSSYVKHPIQDSSPHGTVLGQDSQNNPTITQVVHTAVSPNCQTQETSQRTAQATPSASTDAVAGCLSNLAAENEENFSKPDVLRGEEPFSVSSDRLQISHMTMERSPFQPQAVPNPYRAEEPVDESVSVTTDDPMFSSSTTAVLSQHVSDSVVPVQNSAPRALENGFQEVPCPNQPVEDHYESICQSLQTRVHIVKVSEGRSVQNLSGQPPSMVRPTTARLNDNGKTESIVQSISEDQPSRHIQDISQCIQENNASEQASPSAGLTTYAEPAYPATVQKSELKASGQINIPQSEQREESQGVLQRFQSSSHLIVAAAVCMAAVFVAWRLKY
ncbi:mitochondrial antiviral-signaling protein [Ictalurus furcatus]|uniref:mitochondrial antiviral-signaling protein n=1 Tax=Ictalurus furcatus TaxID=66913 RepID=UPI00235006EF|nr:mitochondrial antiviral-signaling protein [Ictalurus furcatus]XP_053476952.1 mitochondrial antiviral-signaling protein [Ictalurus furcatus]XP_053476953.1 mitochondrial antiviral-signaling protein [Ictalurus furcatus]